jgi:cell division protein FtsA
MPKDKIITGIDIGSTKINTTVAAVSDNKVSVIGVSGDVPSKGINKGNVVDIDSAVESIHNSIERSERMAGVSIHSAFVTINGSHIENLNSHGVVAVSPSDTSEIISDDVVRVIDAAKAISLPSTREIIHVIPRDFSVDSQDGIKDPVGMSGVRLEVETNIIHSSATAAKNIIKCVDQVGVAVEELVYAAIASSESVLTDTEKELGTLLVDIGGGTTSMVAFVEGSPVHSAALPIGGRLITSDLAIGLRAKLEDAERIKLDLSNKARVDKTGRNEGDLDLSQYGLEVEKIPISGLTGIIDARLKEIFELVSLEVSKAELSKKLPAGLVITGGAAYTVGVEKVAKSTLRLPVRIGIPKGVTGLVDEIQGASSSATVGAVLYGANLYREGSLLSLDDKGGSMGKNVSRFFDKLKSFLP